MDGSYVFQLQPHNQHPFQSFKRREQQPDRSLMRRQTISAQRGVIPEAGLFIIHKAVGKQNGPGAFRALKKFFTVVFYFGYCRCKLRGELQRLPANGL